MSTKRYDQFAAGSAASTQIILTADPVTGVLGKIALSSLPTPAAPTLEAVLTAGAAITTNHFITASNHFVDSLFDDGATGIEFSETLQSQTTLSLAYSNNSSNHLSQIILDDTGTAISLQKGAVTFEFKIIDTGCSILKSGVSMPSFAGNAAALAAGLVVGNLYRNGDALNIVH